MHRIKNINDVSEKEYNYFYSLMSVEKKSRVDRFRFDEDKKRSVCGEMLARKMLAEQSGCAVETFVFSSDENGKPYAENSQLEFSISHSGDMAACAVSKTPVGIDIERIRDVDERLIRYVCSEKELEYVFAGNNQNETTKRFFRIWTVKEAYFKCLGTGITNLKSICIFDDEIKQKSESFYYQDYAVSIYNKNK